MLSAKIHSEIVEKLDDLRVLFHIGEMIAPFAIYMEKPRSDRFKDITTFFRNPLGC